MNNIMLKNFHITVDIISSFVGEWWLDAGTCLGAVREGGFIEGDYDIDIGVLSSYSVMRDKIIESFKSYGAKHVKERYYRDSLVTLGFVRMGVKIDLFFYYQEKKFVWHALYKRGVFYPVVFDAKLFNDLKQIEFKGRKCFLPNPPERYLKARYGQDWRVPKSEFAYWDSNDTKAINMEFL